MKESTTQLINRLGTQLRPSPPHVLDRKFVTAGVWSIVGALFAVVGLTHAYQLDGNTVDFLFIFAQPTNPQGALVYRSWDVAIGYLLMSGAFFGVAWYARGRELGEMEH